MDLATVSGLLIALAALFAAMVMDGGHFASLMNASAFVLILGGTIGATIMSFSMKDASRLHRYIGQGFRGKAPDFRGLVETMVGLAELARREGLMSLENKTSEVSYPLLAHGMELVASALDLEQVSSILEAEMAEEHRQRLSGAEMLEVAGGYSPTMGIIGTVMGLVHVLGNLSDAEKLAGSIAVAFLATLYGISFANLFWLPLASKLKLQAQQQMLADELVLEGIMEIGRGVNPRLVRDKLESMAALKPASVDKTEKEKAPARGKGEKATAG